MNRRDRITKTSLVQRTGDLGDVTMRVEAMIDLLKRILRPSGSTPPERSRRARLTLPVEYLRSPIYAVSDIHGCHDLLLDAESRIKCDIERLGSPGLLIMLGDYIDRGPQSSKVVDHIMRDEKNTHFARIALCGNHEEMALEALPGGGGLIRWMATGGDATLLSYGAGPNLSMLHAKAPPLSFLPQEHIEYISTLPITAQVGDFLFVHAGIQPGIPIAHQRESDMMWIREPFLTQGPKLDLTVIHGHTPRALPDFGPNRIGIDTGCWATGKLCILKISEGTVSILGAGRQ